MSGADRFMRATASGVSLAFGLVIIGGVVLIRTDAFQDYAHRNDGTVRIKVADSNVEVSPVTMSRQQEDDLKLMAANIYYEARNQDVTGMEAVAYVALNRLRDGRFGRTLEDIITARSLRQSKKHPHKKVLGACQFSWVCETDIDPKNKAKWEQSYSIAYRVMMYGSAEDDPTGGAIYYMNPKATKKRWPHLQKTVAIGDHVFYKERSENNT